jgi:hypothetical protein
MTTPKSHLLASQAQAQLEELKKRINEGMPFDRVVDQARLLVQTADQLEPYKYQR